MISPFGRDLNSIKYKLETFNDDCKNDKTNFEIMLQSVSSLVVDSWGTSVPIQILLITDGAPGFGYGSLRDTIKRCSHFPFQAKMNILSLSTFTIISPHIASCIKLLRKKKSNAVQYTYCLHQQVILMTDVTQKIVSCFKD